MKISHVLTVTGLGMAMIVLSACAERPMGAPGDPAFLRGLADGLLAPVAFILSLFSDAIRMYAFPNIGRWYDFGFLLGLSVWGGGGGATVTRYVYVDRATRRRVPENEVVVDDRRV